MFNCLFGDQAQLKVYEDLYCRSEGPHPYHVANSSGFLEYDELIEICITHFVENQNDIFTKAYKSLTGHDKPSGFSKNASNIPAVDRKNAYEKLELPVDASLEDVKKKFRELALKFHPDKNPNNPASTEKFKEINQAYKLLMDYFRELEEKNKPTNQDVNVASNNDQATNSAQGSCVYRSKLIVIRDKILNHNFGSEGNTKNNDGITRTESASIILERLNVILELNKTINKNHFEFIKLAIQAELKDKTQKTSGFLSIVSRSESTAKLYRDILKLIEDMPQQRITMKLRP